MERDAARGFRQMNLIDSLKRLALESLSPEQEVAEMPDYLVSSIEENLDMASDWLRDFRIEWRKAYGRRT